MVKLSRVIKSAVILACMVLPGGIAYAADEHAPVNAVPVAGVEKQSSEVLRAFTRELAFIKTFAVENPAQFDQKEPGRRIN